MAGKESSSAYDVLKRANTAARGGKEGGPRRKSDQELGYWDAKDRKDREAWNKRKAAGKGGTGGKDSTWKPKNKPYQGPLDMRKESDWYREDLKTKENPTGMTDNYKDYSDWRKNLRPAERRRKGKDEYGKRAAPKNVGTYEGEDPKAMYDMAQISLNRSSSHMWKKFAKGAAVIGGIALTGGALTGGLGSGLFGGTTAATTGGSMGGMASSVAGSGGSGIVAGGMTTAGATGLTGALSPALAAVQAGTAASYSAALASGLSGSGTAAGTAAATGGGGLYNASSLTSAPGGGPGIAGSTAGQVGVGGVTGGANMGLWNSVLDYGGQAVDAMGGWEGVLGTGMDMAGSYMEGQANAEGNQQAFAAMNPFAGYRDKYAGQMDAFMSDPNSITETPGYKFQMEQGMNALNATSAARGTRLSGGAMIEAQKFGQGLASQMRQQEIQNLSMLSGAGWTPSGGSFKVDSKTSSTAGFNEAMGTLGGVIGYNKGDTSSTEGLVNLLKGLL